MENFQLSQVPICVLKLQSTPERRHFNLISFLVSRNLGPFVPFRKLVTLRTIIVNQSQPTSQRGSRQKVCFRTSLCACRVVKKEDDHPPKVKPVHPSTSMRGSCCGALHLLHPEHSNPFTINNQALGHKM